MTTAYHTDYKADMGDDPCLHVRRVQGVDGKIAMEISASGYLAVHASGLNFLHITTSKEAVAVPHGLAFAPHADNLDKSFDTDDFEEAVMMIRQGNALPDIQSEGH